MGSPPTGSWALLGLQCSGFKLGRKVVYEQGTHQLGQLLQQQRLARCLRSAGDRQGAGGGTFVARPSRWQCHSGLGFVTDEDLGIVNRLGQGCLCRNCARCSPVVARTSRAFQIV